MTARYIYLTLDPPADDVNLWSGEPKYDPDGVDKCQSCGAFSSPPEYPTLDQDSEIFLTEMCREGVVKVLGQELEAGKIYRLTISAVKDMGTGKPLY